MIYKKITVFTEETDRASARFLMLGAPGTELIASTEEDLQCFQFDYVDLSQPEYHGVAAYFEVDAHHPEKVLLDSGRAVPLDELLRSLEESGFAEYEVEEMNSADWENEWKKYLKPSFLSRFTVIPLVEEESEQTEHVEGDSAHSVQTDIRSADVTSGASDNSGTSGNVSTSGNPSASSHPSTSSHPGEDESGCANRGEPIYIIPGKAFGTGVHETTQLCIELLTKYVRPGARVADIGTGSGILAIAAKKLGASEVVAIDNDADALENAALNAGQNAVRLHLHLGHLANDLDGTMDVVVANIIVKAVIELADKAKELLKKERKDGEGIYICSGIIQEEKANVASALEAKGYRILEVMDMGEWCAVAASPK